MSYSLSTYTVRITSSSQLQVIARSGEAVQKTVDLTQVNGKVFLIDEEDFDIIGDITAEGEYLSQVNPSDNDVTLTGEGELINIGQSCSIELQVFNAYLCKNVEGGICFYEAEIDSASKCKAA